MNGWNEWMKCRDKRIEWWKIDENSAMWWNTPLWWKFIAEKKIHQYADNKNNRLMQNLSFEWKFMSKKSLKIGLKQLNLTKKKGMKVASFLSFYHEWGWKSFLNFLF